MGWRKPVVCIATLVVAAGGLGACGKSSTSGHTLATACTDELAINDGFNQIFGQLRQGQGPSAAVAQQIKDEYSQLLSRPISDIEAHSPSPIKADIRAAVAAARKFGTSGDPAALNAPGVDSHIARLSTYFYDHCSGTKQAVGAVDYEFTAPPDRLAAGIVWFRFNNAGKENHEMLVLTRKSGVSETFDQILALPKEQARQKVDSITGSMASPGTSDFTSVRLRPGQYIMICTVPKGSVGEKQGDGPPHFTLGMRHEFTVT